MSVKLEELIEKMNEKDIIRLEIEYLNPDAWNSSSSSDKIPKVRLRRMFYLTKKTFEKPAYETKYSKYYPFFSRINE